MKGSVAFEGRIASGNMLGGGSVLDAMAEALSDPQAAFEKRLLYSLRAARGVGGGFAGSGLRPCLFRTRTGRH